MTVAAAGRLLVLGVGNPLRSDDGVGPAVAARLAADPRLHGADVRMLHQLTPELAPDVAEAALVVVVDADLCCTAAGSVSVRWLTARGSGGAPADGAMSHHLDAQGLADLAAVLFGNAAPVAVVGVGVASLGVGEGLTHPVTDAVPRVIDAVVELVEAQSRA